MHTMHTNYEPANWMDEMQCVLDACLECVYMQVYHTIVQMFSVDVRVYVCAYVMLSLQLCVQQVLARRACQSLELHAYLPR